MKLPILSHCVLFLSPGKKDPEKGFSFNNFFFIVHEASNQEETIEVRRFLIKFVIEMEDYLTYT